MEGKCRFGYVIGLTSSTLSGPSHFLQWTSKFAGELANRSSGGEVYAISEMADQTSLLKDCFEAFGGLGPGMAWLEDCEGAFSNLETRKTIVRKYLVRCFLSTHQALGECELDNGFWSRGTKNPADGLTQVRSDMAPLFRLLESGHLNPGALRP